MPFLNDFMHVQNIFRWHEAERKMDEKSNLKPYTVHYRDFQNIRLENCFYAFDAYEARTLAMEFNKYIKDHPNSIDLIRCEN